MAFDIVFVGFVHKKFNLLVFLVGIADHVGPLVNMHRTE
jgi:hypothetical protein